MLFLSAVIIIWLAFVYLFYKGNRENFSLSNALLPLLLFSIILTIDFHLNYQTAANPLLNDGIGCSGYFSYWILGDNGWSLPLFREAYDFATFITCILILLFATTLIVDPFKKKGKT